MKLIIRVLLVFFICLSFGYAQDVIELGSTQSMGISGKGPGKDGAINPYLDVPSLATVKNKGDHPFVVRIQEKGKILAEVLVAVDEKKLIYLKPGFEMYFDSTKPTEVKVSFKKYKN